LDLHISQSPTYLYQKERFIAINTKNFFHYFSNSNESELRNYLENLILKFFATDLHGFLRIFTDGYLLFLLYC